MDQLRTGGRLCMPLGEARKRLIAKYSQIQGELYWYCLDHWSERLGLDVMKLHRDNHERIEYLPGAREFLEAVHASDKKVLLVTNSHPDTLSLKQKVTGFSEYFDGIHSAHTYGYAKERQEFWHALQEEEHFDPATTLFVDDTEPVLQSAAEFGLGVEAEDRGEVFAPVLDEDRFVVGDELGRQAQTKEDEENPQTPVPPPVGPEILPASTVEAGETNAQKSPLRCGRRFEMGAHTSLLSKSMRGSTSM